MPSGLRTGDYLFDQLRSRKGSTLYMKALPPTRRQHLGDNRAYSWRVEVNCRSNAGEITSERHSDAALPTIQARTRRWGASGSRVAHSAVRGEGSETRSFRFHRRSHRLSEMLGGKRRYLFVPEDCIGVGVMGRSAKHGGLGHSCSRNLRSMRVGEGKRRGILEEAQAPFDLYVKTTSSAYFASRPTLRFLFRSASPTS